MKEIKELSKFIECEIEDAEKYLIEAMKYKESNEALAETYYTLSEEEMKHANMLHVMGTKLISDYVSKGGVVPPEMQSVYDYLHEKHIEKFNAIKVGQSVYKS